MGCLKIDFLESSNCKQVAIFNKFNKSVDNIPGRSSESVRKARSQSFPWLHVVGLQSVLINCSLPTGTFRDSYIPTIGKCFSFLFSNEKVSKKFSFDLLIEIASIFSQFFSISSFALFLSLSLPSNQRIPTDK